MKERFLSFLARVGLNESGVLIGLLAVMAAVWGFAELADEVMDGSTEQLDTNILLFLRNPADLSDPIGAHWVEEIGRDVTALGGVALLSFIALAVVGFLSLQDKYRSAIFVGVAIGGGMLASALLKSAFSRPRPDLVPHGSYVYTTSFPSGHSMMSAVVFLTLGALLARFQPSLRVKAYLIALSVLLTLAVGVSRVYLGVHWPADVLAGWTAGAAWALACWTVARALQRRGQIEEDHETSAERERRCPPSAAAEARPAL